MQVKARSVRLEAQQAKAPYSGKQTAGYAGSNDLCALARRTRRFSAVVILNYFRRFAVPKRLILFGKEHLAKTFG